LELVEQATVIFTPQNKDDTEGILRIVGDFGAWIQTVFPDVNVVSATATPSGAVRLVVAGTLSAITGFISKTPIIATTLLNIAKAFGIFVGVDIVRGAVTDPFGSKGLLVAGAVIGAVLILR